MSCREHILFMLDICYICIRLDSWEILNKSDKDWAALKTGKPCMLFYEEKSILCGM